jgi:putative transcriptional regulator
MSKLGERLIRSAREARLIAQGKAVPSSYRVHVPADIDVREIREKLNLSQTEFSSRFGVTLATLRDWEQGRRKPEGPARVLMLVIKSDPDAVTRALQPKRQSLTATREPAHA